MQRSLAGIREKELRMAAPDRTVEIPSGMQHKLDTFQRRVWKIKVAEGILAALFGLVISYIAVFALDRIYDTPVVLRGAILALGAAGLGLFFPLKCRRWVWNTRKMEQIARLIRQKSPRFGDQLLGTIELARNESEQKRSAVLIQAAIAQVDLEVQQRDLTEAVPTPRHWQWGVAVLVPVIVVVGLFVLAPLAGSNAFARWLMPWRDTERYTFAQLDELPDELIVPYAEEYQLNVPLKKGSRWAPEIGQAEISGQPTLQAKLSDSKGYSFALPPQTGDRSVNIVVGDARGEVALKPTIRPELTEVQADVQLPAYLQREQSLNNDVRGGVLTVLKGSNAKLSATVSRELDEATVDGVPQDVEGDTILTSAFTATENLERSLEWRDTLGLSSKEPFVIRIDVIEDQAPAVQINDLKREQVVLHSDAVTFAVFASDDYGLRRVGLEWEGVPDEISNPNPAKGEMLLSPGGADQREIDAAATFSAAREGVAPQVLRVRAFTEDFRPDGKRVYSADFILYVLSAEEHAIWLTRQFGKWMRDADEVYQREQQLHTTNNDLRQMDPDELERPENRRKVEKQASAERANGARLSGVTRAGKQLLEQATQNDQFNIQTLETWADMMNKLDDLANNRMPSIADMLSAAAKAPGPPKAPSEGDGGKTPPSVGNVRDNKQGKAEKKESEEDAGQTTPKIVDVESGFNEVKEGEDNQPPPSGGPGKFGLPGSVVQGGGADQKPATECPLQEQVDQAFKDQAQLLADFEKIRDELQKLLGNLEGSTFVKRLKAASRRQLEVAGDLNAMLIDTFGAEGELDKRIKSRTDQVADREFSQSENVYTIQEDLDAYFARMQEGKFKTVLDEMRETNAVGELKEIGDTIKVNLNGQSLVKAEFWADNLDRWAEQLVGPGDPGGT
jgi:hypothetical protein